MNRINRLADLDAELALLKEHDTLVITPIFHCIPLRIVAWKAVDNGYPKAQITFEYNLGKLTTLVCGTLYTPREVLTIKKDLLTWLTEEI